MSDGALIAIPLLLTSTVSVGLAVLAWRMSELRSKSPLILLLCFGSLLSFSYLLELVSPTLDGKLFWNDVEYVSNVAIPPCFLLIALVFVGRSSTISKRFLILLSAIPALTLAILWTNDQTHLFYQNVSMTGSGYLASYDVTYGPWWYVHSLYSFSLLGYSFLVLLGAYLRSSRMHRKQIRTIIISGLLPIMAFALAYSGQSPISLTYLLILSFMGSASLIFLGTFQYELFDVMPLALDTVVERMKDGAIVLDNRGRIVHVNPSGAEIVGRTQEKAYAARLSEVLPNVTEVALENALATEKMLEVFITRGDKDHYYDVQVTAMTDQGGGRTGLMLILRDIDDERRMKDSLKMANTRLNMMSVLVRHDTLNQVGVIRGYSELMSTGHLKESDVLRYADSIREAVKYIEHQFKFAQQYQGLGRSEPVWQWMQLVLAKAKTTGASEGLDIQADLGSLSVLADPLLEKVFTILLDNTQRHGKSMGAVSLRYRIKGKGCIITYQDHGAGVALSQKALIFNKDYDTHGGMDLYIAQQIMEMAGGSIQEIGIEGEGSVFEITFPEGRWKEERIEQFDQDENVGRAKAT
jgi:PAS domain S-box-containing protein